MDKATLLNMDRRAKPICETEPCLAYVGPFQYKVTVRSKGFPTACKTFDDIDEALDWRNEKKSEMRRGRYVDTREIGRTTMADVIDRYGREVSPGKRGYKKELSRLNVIKRHPFCQEYIGNITGAHIAKFRDSRLKDVSDKTVREDLIVLGHVFKIAMQEWGMPLPANPTDHVRKPKAPIGRNRRLKEGEENKLILSCQTYGDSKKVMKAIVAFALETAMRRGEIANLEWKHINFDDKEAHVVRGRNGLPRDVPLTPKAYGVLDSLHRNIGGSVFGMTSDSIGKAFRRITSRATDDDGKPEPIKDLRFHDLRHEATSRFFEQGYSTEDVMLITGHKTYQMVGRYTHLKPQSIVKKMWANHD